jgi:hypothetical protein
MRSLFEFVVLTLLLAKLLGGAAKFMGRQLQQSRDWSEVVAETSAR